SAGIATRVDFPKAPLVHELFARRAAEAPDSIAVIAEGRAVSYAALEDLANHAARALQRRGVGPERRVAIFLPRSIGMVSAILGVLKAGGAWVPIEPDTPDDRLVFLLKDARPTCLVTTSRAAAR